MKISEESVKPMAGTVWPNQGHGILRKLPRVLAGTCLHYEILTIGFEATHAVAPRLSHPTLPAPGTGIPGYHLPSLRDSNQERCLVESRTFVCEPTGHLVGS
jgi:hypothetical protein